MITPEQFRPQVLSEAFRQLIIHANAVVEFSQAMLEDKDDSLNELQEANLWTLKKSAQTFLDIINERLELDSEQLVSFVIDENLQSVTDQRLVKPDDLPQVKYDLIWKANSISGFSRVLLKGLDGSITETQENSLMHIQENGQELFQILHQIFDSWNIEDIVDKTTLSYGEINIKQVTDKFVDWVKKYGKAEIVGNGLDGLATIRSDTIRFHSIMHFIISALSSNFTRGRIIFKAKFGGEAVTISIRNPKLSLSEFTIEKFEQVRSLDALLSDEIPPLSSFNEAFDLCISRLLVEILGGEMHLEKVEASSIVTFALPMEKEN